jgi:hypothetical protein
VTRIKHGREPDDPRLGRIAQWDPNNAAWPIRSVLPVAAPLEKRTWRLERRDKLDQLNEGSCVGHGWAHRINAAPRRRHLTHMDAVAIYRGAQRLDEYPGEEPDVSGTSVIAGAKFCQRIGRVDIYRWCLTLDDVLAAISHEGPVVMGTEWRSGMWEPDAKGYVHVTGKVAGGHCYLARGIDPDRERVRCTNSWGLGYGISGDFYLSFDDLGKLLEAEGEAVVPTER